MVDYQLAYTTELVQELGGKLHAERAIYPCDGVHYVVPGPAGFSTQRRNTIIVSLIF
jgi:hypothetical protein